MTERTRKILHLSSIVAMCVSVGAILWFWVFPWIDRTYINRPGIGG